MAIKNEYKGTVIEADLNKRSCFVFSLLSDEKMIDYSMYTSTSSYVNVLNNAYLNNSMDIAPYHIVVGKDEIIFNKNLYQAVNFSDERKIYNNDISILFCVESLFDIPNKIFASLAKSIAQCSIDFQLYINDIVMFNEPDLIVFHDKLLLLKKISVMIRNYYEPIFSVAEDYLLDLSEVVHTESIPVSRMITGYTFTVSNLNCEETPVFIFLKTPISYDLNVPLLFGDFTQKYKPELLSSSFTIRKNASGVGINYPATIYKFNNKDTYIKNESISIKKVSPSNNDSEYKRISQAYDAIIKQDGVDVNLFDKINPIRQNAPESLKTMKELGMSFMFVPKRFDTDNDKTALTKIKKSQMQFEKIKNL